MSKIVKSQALLKGRPNEILLVRIKGRMPDRLFYY